MERFIRFGKKSNSIFYFLYIPFLLFQCRTDRRDAFKIPTDSYSIIQGKKLFTFHCGSCHNFHFDGIGPGLAGITDRVPIGWIQDFISNSSKMIDSGDDRANQLYKKFKVPMPAFGGLGDTAIHQIISYLHTRKPIPLSNKYKDRMEVINPIPDTIEMSHLVLDLKLIHTFPVSNANATAPLARITKLDYEVHTGQSYVLDMNGILYRMVKDSPQVYFELPKHIDHYLNQPGLSSGFAQFAFHPEFYKNGLLYTAHSEPAATKPADFTFEDTLECAMQFVISEWKTNDPNSSKFNGTQRELMRIDMVSKAHGVQEISFNPTAQSGSDDFGLLYIAVGDAGAGENRYPFLLNSPSRVWGTIMRIDPDPKHANRVTSKNGKYSIPLSNPFVATKGALKEVYAYGFRNPHRITWTKNGYLLVSNIGHGDIEALDLVQAGQNFGWPYMEGNWLIDPYGDLTKIYAPIETDTFTKKISRAVAQFDHDEGKAIAGGFEYTGSIPGLKGKFITGDIPIGNIYYANISEIAPGKNAKLYECRLAIDGKIIQLKDVANKNRLELHFGKDSKGEIYLMTKVDGRLYKVSGARYL